MRRCQRPGRQVRPGRHRNMSPGTTWGGFGTPGLRSLWAGSFLLWPHLVICGLLSFAVLVPIPLIHGLQHSGGHVTKGGSYRGGHTQLSCTLRRCQQQPLQLCQRQVSHRKSSRGRRGALPLVPGYRSHTLQPSLGQWYHVGGTAGRSTEQQKHPWDMKLQIITCQFSSRGTNALNFWPAALSNKDKEHYILMLLGPKYPLWSPKITLPSR